MDDELRIKLLPRSKSGSSGSGSDDEQETTADYEKAISSTGYGKFHYLLLLTCGWANASDAVELLCVSFLLPSAECDLSLTSTDKGWLSSSPFIGMLIGGYIWGSLGDTLGRKRILIVSLFVNAFCGFASSLSQGKTIFLILRFLSGVGVGGSIPLVWSYFAEFQPKNKRGAMLSIIAMFWMVGNVTVAGIAWLVIPYDLGTDINGCPPGPSSDCFQFNSWRIFTLLSGMPALLVAFSLFFFPESPKYLLAKGLEKEALHVFATVYSINTGKPRNSYQIDRVRLEKGTPLLNEKDPSLMETLKEILRNSIRLFHPSLFRVTVIMCFIHFSIQFGYYGLWLWFPQLFAKLDDYHTRFPNETDVSVCTVTAYKFNSTGTEPTCGDPPENAVFWQSFVTSLSALPGNVWTIVHMDKFGRKFFLVLSMVLSGASAFGIYLVTSSTANLVLTCVFGAVSTMGFNSLDCLSIELFPTHLRSTAMAVTLAVARLGAILGTLIFGYFLEVNCAIPIVSVAILLVGGGLLCLLLPNTTQTPLA